MTNIINQANNLQEYLDLESKLTTKEKEKEFEKFCILWLKTNPLYSPHTTIFDPNLNEVPLEMENLWNIGSLLKGARSEGADAYKLTDETGIAFEMKYQHADDTSIKGSKLSIKEVALNKTNIKMRILMTNQNSVSGFVKDKLDHWGTIFGDTIYTEEAFQHIKYFLKHKKPYAPAPTDYREDLLYEVGDKTFHENSMKDMWKEIQRQIKEYGNARVLVIKPTASGKGSDDILYQENFFRPHNIGKKLLTCGVNPSLTVLQGNLGKRIKEIKARNSNIKVFVLASDPTRGETDKELLQIVKTYCKVINANELLDVILDWQDSNYDLHIETTVHSYKNLGNIIDIENITADSMYIDEVKKTVQDEDSDFTACLDDTCGKWLIRIGADANEVDAKDEQGNHMPYSMGNRNYWRSVPVRWQEEDVVKRGWKRKTKLEVYRYDINEISDPKLREMIGEGLKFDFHYKGHKVPKMWAIQVHMLVSYFLNHPTRKHPLNHLNSRERVAQFCAFAQEYAKEVVLQRGDLRNPAIKRIHDMIWTDIYANGNTHSKIQKTVDSIPDGTNKINVANQVKKVAEGWDPKDGFIDTVLFTDPSDSKIRISQSIGRGQRLGQGFDDLIVPIAILYDSTDQYDVKNNGMKQVQKVANALELGKNIEDSITFFDHNGKEDGPGEGRTKGKKNKRSVFDLDGNTFAEAFKSFYNTNSWNPFENIVEEIYKDSLGFYDVTYGNQFAMKEFHNKIAQDPRYKDFFDQYDGLERCRRAIASIRLGKHFLLSLETKLEAKKKWKQFNKDRKQQMELTDRLIVEFAENFDPTKLNNNDIFYCKEKMFISFFNKECLKYVNENGGKISRGGLQFAYGQRGRWDQTSKIKTAIDNACEIIKTHSQNFSDKIFNQFKKEYIKYAAPTTNQINVISKSIATKYSLTIPKVSRMNKLIENKEKIQKNHLKVIRKLYQDNYLNFKEVNLLDEAIVNLAMEKGIITNKFFCADRLRRKELKDITEYFKVVGRQTGVSRRKKYDSGVAVKVTTPKGQFKSVRAAADAEGCTIEQMRGKIKYWNSKYYHTEKGPGKDNPPKSDPSPKVTVCEGKEFFSLTEAAKHYGIGLSSMRDRMKAHPNKYYYKETA